ncbi:subtilisin-like protease SBT3.2 [Pistacia vera]|uniref:subtilisin-like protease SBT3.2 n=1 Tax=Pistacia vera TaxID=55513 RepID=UPI001262FBC2|nr:subtilisin-like protease SBT3.2 [Pistacia vera]
MDPGLIYDMGVSDYSLRSLTVSRTVTNVGPVNSVYTARVQTPAGATVGVEPSTLTFNSTVKTLKFKVTFRSSSEFREDTRLDICSGDGLHHVVRIPLIVRTVIDVFIPKHDHRMPLRVPCFIDSLSLTAVDEIAELNGFPGWMILHVQSSLFCTPIMENTGLNGHKTGFEPNSRFPASFPSKPEPKDPDPPPGKIIGARWYIKGYEAEFGKLNTSDGVEFLSPRDAVGHGTHTASTAAGAPVKNASFMGLAQGIARGGAPLASLAVYKVCWATGGCSSADLLAAFDDAVSDGVNVLSVSLGSSPPLSTYFDDLLSIGSFHAAAKGIAVVCSAGNSGPYPQTVINTAPWIITVAASTIDRSFPTAITMGNNQTVVGQAFYTGRMDMNKFYPIVYGEDIASIDADEDSASSCDSGTLNATLARGKIVICFQSRSQRSVATAARTVMAVQGVGLIFAQFPTKDVQFSFGIPSVLVDFVIATSLLTYMQASRNPLVKFSFTKTVIGQQLSPEVAFFSSRGPSSLSPSVLKPDITAPGVNVLASWSPASSPDTDNSIPPLNFKIESGTSMSCPHVSGIVALLKGKYQTWSPAAIKSALITTASLKDEYDQIIVSEGAPHKQADPFDYGGGHVNPNKAMDPGLIYDMGVSDYVHFLCGMGYNNSAISSMTKTQTRCFRKSTRFLVNLNLPSITIPELKKSLTVSRTVTNVGPMNSVYTARVQTPAGATVGVEPSTLTFNSTVKTLKFKVTFRSQLRVQGRYSFGYLFWEDGLHHVVRIPLIVRTVIDDFYSQT